MISLGEFVTLLTSFLSCITEVIRNILGITRTCDCQTRLDGQVVVITGGNTGIGKETAYQLSLRGAKIIIGCRDLTRGENAIKDIKQLNPKADIQLLKLDLSSLSSVRQFVDQIKQKVPTIDILINNAGVMMCPEWTTDDGFEMQFGTNHLGHFLLTLSVMDLLKKSTTKKARVINVSSKAHLFGKINFENINLKHGAYNPGRAYHQSKLANVLFSRELARRLGPDSNVATFSLHPGMIYTELGRHMPLQFITQRLYKLISLTVQMGAQTTLYCALEPGLDNKSGTHYDDCQRVDKMVPNAVNDDDASKLWLLSCDLVKLDSHLRLD